MALTTTAESPGDAMFGLPRSKTELDMRIDGGAHESSQHAFVPTMPDTQLIVSAQWQGETLLVNEPGAGFGGLTRTQRRFFLSGDRRRLVELVESHSTFGDSEQRLVFDKSDSKFRTFESKLGQV